MPLYGPLYLKTLSYRPKIPFRGNGPGCSERVQPDRNIPSPQGFTCLHQRLTESGSVQKQRNEMDPALDVFTFKNKILQKSGRGP